MIDRKIYLIGDIDHDLAREFFQEMDRLEHESQDVISIELASAGGDAYLAMSMAHRIHTSPCTTNIVGRGYVASAAVIILASGTNRVLAPDSWVMVHEDQVSGEDADGPLRSIENYTRHLRAVEDHWNVLMEKYTGTPVSVWEKLHMIDTYLTSDECVKYKIIDEVRTWLKKR